MILKASRFIRNRTGIRRILPLRSLSHVKRRDLRGSESAAKGGQMRVMKFENPRLGGRSESLRSFWFSRS